MEPEVLSSYVVGIARSVAYHGLKKLVFVNGHGGNTQALMDAARRLREEGIFAYVYIWWRAVAEEIREVMEDAGGHAGGMEASVVWHIAPDLVRSDRFREAAEGAAEKWGRTIHGVEVGYDTIDFSSSGCVGDPGVASPEKGRRILEAAVAKLVEFCRWLSGSSPEELSPKPHKP